MAFSVLAFGFATDAVAQALCAADGTPVEIKIIGPTGAVGFGEQIALSADTLAISAPRESVDGIGEAGAVYVYRYAAGTWWLEQRLPAPEPGAFNKFGRALDLEGDHLIVGDPIRADGPTKPTAGAVHFYQRFGTIWTRTQVFAGPADNDFLGTSVAIDVSIPKNSLSGEPLYTAVAGAPNHDFGGPNHVSFGAAFVFELGPSGTWAPTLALCRTPQADDWCLADPSPETGEGWGQEVGLGGDFLLIGSTRFSAGVGNGGGIRPMRRANDTGTFFTWASDGIFTASPPQPGERFGGKLAVSGGSFPVLVVGRAPDWAGSTSRVRIYDAVIPGFGLRQILDRGVGESRFGIDVAVTDRGSLVAVGTDNPAQGTMGGGLVDLFLRSQGSWVNLVTLTASDGFSGDLLGASVAVSERFVVAGAPGAVAVYVFGQCESLFADKFQ